jgi:hypothetical protein
MVAVVKEKLHLFVGAVFVLVILYGLVMRFRKRATASASLVA